MWFLSEKGGKKGVPKSLPPMPTGGKFGEKEEDTARVQQLRDHEFPLCGHKRRSTELNKTREGALPRAGLPVLGPAQQSRHALSRLQPQI